MSRKSKRLRKKQPPLMSRDTNPLTGLYPWQETVMEEVFLMCPTPKTHTVVVASRQAGRTEYRRKLEEARKSKGNE